MVTRQAPSNMHHYKTKIKFDYSPPLFKYSYSLYVAQKLVGGRYPHQFFFYLAKLIKCFSTKFSTNGMCWNKWRIDFPIFSFWDMVTKEITKDAQTKKLLLKSGQIYSKDADWSGNDF